MLERLRDTWAERPALVAAGVFAPLAFLITLLVLFVVVGGDAEPAQQVADAAPSTQPDQDGGTATVVVETDDQDSVSDDSGREEQPTNGSSSDETATDEDDEDGRGPGSASTTDPSDSNDAQDDSDEPLVVAGFTVVSLDDALDEPLDESQLKYGSDGSEGGILPIDNGVVVSSGPDYRTTWELIVPSAGIKSTVVRVGRTASGAMGSPDNPYVIGWLDSSAAPGETGNSLLAGHRDFEDISGNVGEGVCWELVNTSPGDRMLVRDVDRDIYFVYTVTEAVTVNPRDRDAARYLQNSDEPLVTLITCTGSFNQETNQYSHRRVVIGVLEAVASPDASG